jgi:hypothetical protein
MAEVAAADWAPVHRVVSIGAARLVATALAEGCHLIRLHPTVEAPYDRMTVVTEREDGAVLFLAGWLGSIVTEHLSLLRAGHAALFPNATAVAWERRRRDGSIHLAHLRI